jgi:hypothetical protein
MKNEWNGFFGELGIGGSKNEWVSVSYRANAAIGTPRLI